MESKTVALIAVFAALTVALTIYSPIRIPAPYAPFLIYQIWEIPIVAAFLLFGPKIGTSIAVINTVVLLLVFQGALPTGPLYNLAAVLSMLLGILFAVKLLSRFKVHSEALVTTSATALGMILRVGIMTAVNYAFLRYPPPVGYSMPEVEILSFLPIIGLFNASVVLYTAPLGQLIAKAVSVSTKITQWGQAAKQV
jgi:riboflavin transporter FmnP